MAPVGEDLWLPARGTDFAAACSVVRNDDDLVALATSADLVIAVKPQPGSFGRAIKLPPEIPVLLDIDDPDLESITSKGNLPKAMVKSVVRARQFWSAKRLARLVSRYPTIVSNPVLQKRYGGIIVPHAREDNGVGDMHTSTTPKVVFVGTNRRHKGTSLLREAVNRQAQDGMTLVVTDSAPDDARAHERWVGQTSFDEGLGLVASGDIVVIPSMPGEIHSQAQLPAKLIDAMMAGRAVIVSDFAPLRWAVGDTGLVFHPGSADSLSQNLRRLTDPHLRQSLGLAARARALDLFSVEAVRQTFALACKNAVRD